MRNKSLPALPPVNSFEVAPHRYLYNAPCPEELPITWRHVRDAAPYKAGDVVYVVYGDEYRRAYVVRVDVEKNSWDEWNEYYWVRRETNKGKFALREYKAYPGFIQRGYQRALRLNDQDQPL